MKIGALKEKYLNFSIILMFMLPAFPTKIKPYIIGHFFLLVLFNSWGEKHKFDTKFFLINSAIYLFMIISIIYSENIYYALKSLERMSSLIIFPLIFSILSSKTKELIYNNKKKYMFIYILTIALLNLMFFSYHFGHYKETLITHYLTVTRTAQGGYNIHPIYLSMHIAVAILFSMFLLYKEKKYLNIVILIFLDGILIFFLLILLKKGPIIALFLSFFLFIILKNKKNLWSLFLVTVIINVILLFVAPKINKKFSELIKVERIDAGNYSSTNIRYSLYYYAFETFRKSPILGHGIGDYRDKLIESYQKEPILFSEKYNTHNQYLSFLLSLGSIGLLLFLLKLTYNYRYAIKNNNHILITLLTLYCFIMVSENILERENGVIFFSFFLSFFNLFSDKKIFKRTDIR